MLGLEQFSAVAHDKGSSHGSSRIIRLQYHEHPDYVPLLHRAYELWHDLEVDSGKVLERQTFLLSSAAVCVHYTQLALVIIPVLLYCDLYPP